MPGNWPAIQFKLAEWRDRKCRRGRYAHAVTVKHDDSDTKWGARQYQDMGRGGQALDKSSATQEAAICPSCGTRGEIAVETRQGDRGYRLSRSNVRNEGSRYRIIEA
ncbi:hypothetical protein GCM10007897_40760 [Sphingobium jiangsuense]|nr:hypothetical protein GCM10007897_40760 [Sphingobium jiangsuense]